MIHARLTLAALVFAFLPGCAALTAFSGTDSLDTYELSPLSPPAAGPIARGPVLRVERPTASGAVASDRIVFKPDARSVTVLPGVRWVDDAPAHVEMLIMRSLTATGRFGLVTGSGAGALPDYLLVGDLVAFEAAFFAAGTPGAPARPGAEIRLTLSLLDASTESVRSSRVFVERSFAASDDPAALVAAFDRAMSALLSDVVGWLSGQAV